MKSNLFSLIIIITFYSCDLLKSDEDIAKENIIEELKPSLRNPDSFVFESIEPLIQISEKEDLYSEIQLLEDQSAMLDRTSENRSQDEIIESITLIKKI